MKAIRFWKVDEYRNPVLVCIINLKRHKVLFITKTRMCSHMTIIPIDTNTSFSLIYIISFWKKISRRVNQTLLHTQLVRIGNKSKNQTKFNVYHIYMKTKRKISVLFKIYNWHILLCIYHVKILSRHYILHKKKLRLLCWPLI